MSDLFDTHCHLFMEPLCGNVEKVLNRAYTTGVKRVLVPSVSADNWATCTELSALPGISCALGVHPWWAADGVDVDELAIMLQQHGACAIGEIGLDWKTEVPREEQFTVLEKQLRLASSLNMPVILHCRNAFDEMLDLLKKYPVAGAIHAWSKGPHLMKRFLDAGLQVSFGGAVTNHRALKAVESVRQVPIDRFVLETDSPSMGLAGVPAGRVEPKHVHLVAEAVARIRGVSLQEIQTAAWNNSVNLFGEAD